MARWTRGESDVEALLAAGELQKLTGAAANGERLLEKATVTLSTARSAVGTDPDSAFVLAYDAARQALTALLAHQGLRPTTKGGHYAVERAVRAQFGPGFRQFGALRRRRNELGVGHTGMGHRALRFCIRRSDGALVGSVGVA